MNLSDPAGVDDRSFVGVKNSCIIRTTLPLDLMVVDVCAQVATSRAGDQNIEFGVFGKYGSEKFLVPLESPYQDCPHHLRGGSTAVLFQLMDHPS